MGVPDVGVSVPTLSSFIRRMKSQCAHLATVPDDLTELPESVLRELIAH